MVRYVFVEACLMVRRSRLTGKGENKGLFQYQIPHFYSIILHEYLVPFIALFRKCKRHWYYMSSPCLVLRLPVDTFAGSSVFLDLLRLWTNGAMETGVKTSETGEDT